MCARTIAITPGDNINGARFVGYAAANCDSPAAADNAAVGWCGIGIGNSDFDSTTYLAATAAAADDDDDSTDAMDDNAAAATARAGVSGFG
jgi:hypothetical protein